MTPKERRALQIRDAAHDRFRRAEPPVAPRRMGPCMTQTITDGPVKIMLSIAVGSGFRQLPYGLDIWTGHGGEVFNITWDDERFILHSFRRGDREERIIAEDPGPSGRAG